MFTADGLEIAKIDRHTLELAASQDDHAYPLLVTADSALSRSLARLITMGLMTPDYVATDKGMAMLAPPREPLVFVMPDMSLVTLPRTDDTLPVIICAWCDQPATRVTDPHNGQAVCLKCAINDHGSAREAKANTFVLGTRARAMLAARYA